MRRFCIFLITTVLLSGCYFFHNPDIDFSEGDISILSANLLYSNPENDKVTKTLLDQNCDVMVLIEANRGKNFNADAFLVQGYENYFYESNMVGFNIFIASKIPGTKLQIDNYGYMGYAPEYDYQTNFLFGELRLTLKGRNIILLATHLPSPFHFGRFKQDVIFDNLANQYDFTEGRLIENSGTEVISYPIICGDFNAFPHEDYFKEFKNKGLVDTFIGNPDPYDYTWGFTEGPSLARIDYIFVSKHFLVLLQKSFEIPGSDHRGVKTSITLPE